MKMKFDYLSPKMLSTIRWFAFTAHGAMCNYIVHKHLRDATKVVDVGSRRSPFTEGMGWLVTAIDLPSSEGDELGINPSRRAYLDKRTDVEVLLADISRCCLLDVFQGAIMTEVIEHIENDRSAIANIANCLSNDGVLVLTTPNGQIVPNTNRFHVRHYKPEDLFRLLKEYFKKVSITDRLQVNRFSTGSHRGPLGVLHRDGLVQFIMQYLRVAMYRLSVLDGRRIGDGTTLVAICSGPRRNLITDVI